MSDPFRKSLGDKTKEHMTPDSSKSTVDELKETFTDTTDKVARGAQSDHSKSTSQSMADKASRSKDQHVHGSAGDSIVDKTKNALGMGGRH